MGEPRVVLGLDTAGPVVGAALIGAGEDRVWTARLSRGADAALLTQLSRMLEGVARLDAVAVSVGPGAFTSLRVGVAVALGLAVSRGCPVVPMSSLDARALAAGGERVLALLDGRKGRAYAAWYPRFEPVREHDLAPEEAVRLAAPPFVATGEGALVWRGLVEKSGGRVHPDADASPALLLARYAAAHPELGLPPDRVRLNYLRDADAVPPAQ